MSEVPEPDETTDEENLSSDLCAQSSSECDSEEGDGSQGEDDSQVTAFEKITPREYAKRFLATKTVVQIQRELCTKITASTFISDRPIILLDEDGNVIGLES